MSSAGPSVPEEWRALFEGRSVAFADLPPAPIRPVRGFTRFLLRAIPLLAVTVIAVAASVGLAMASGHWWVGLIVFLCSALLPDHPGFPGSETSRAPKRPPMRLW